ncbi:MAG: xylR [Chthoniobacteraceae bacterium]|nr:xylR [Chthoniobacteraceae bacterium]
MSGEMDPPPSARIGRLPPLSQTPKVALMIETSNAYARRLLAGVRDYIRSHGPWNVHLAEHSRGDSPPTWIADWNGDGVLARVENKQIARALADLHVPLVDLASHRHLPGVPVVTTDDAHIARLAFQHFREREFRHFAYCGVKRFAWSMRRGGFFDKLVREAGFSCEHYVPALDFGPDSDAETDAVADWLRKLPQPIALFAAYDARGQQVLEACQRAELSVPEQVAVLGVDNDDLLCEFSLPPLSSIIPDTQRAGWEAAALLDRMMRGEQMAPEIHRIPPIGICARQSTDVTAVEDVHVAKAAQFIREHAREGIDVGDVVAAVPLARRVLEKRFRSLLGRTLREEITRVQMQRVKDLLVGTDLSLAQIAERTGFRHVEYLTVSFKREYGIPPSVYRLKHQSHHPRAPAE